MIKIYTDGSCLGNPGNGGWAAIILNDGEKTELKGSKKDTTNNQMELLAPIEALKKIPKGSKVQIFTDSKYVKSGITEWIHNWKKNGELNVPVFDKSLRNGLGDRSHWRFENPDLLILEGWFLGVTPFPNDISNQPINTLNLSLHESSYVLKIQNNLNEYLDIWTLIDNIWHLKPLKIEYMNIWKTNQEKEMFSQKGNALKDEYLSNFLRMLIVSIPHKSFDVIKSYALLLIDQDRKLVEAGLNL